MQKESSFDYICPRVCPGRSKDCHSTCERHKKFRSLAESERNTKFLTSYLSADARRHLGLTDGFRKTDSRRKYENSKDTAALQECKADHYI